MNDDVRRRLEEAGRRPVAPPDPAFADALEARLRAVAATRPPAPEPSAPAPSPERRRRPVFGWRAAAAGLAGIALVVAGIGAALLRPDGAPGPGTPLEEPVNVEVVLANGTILEDPDGLLLPEGAIVRVGEGGSARIGDVALGPGDVATVRADRVEVQRPTPVAVVPGATPGRSPRPTGTPGSTPVPSASPPIATPTPAPTPTPERSGSPAPTRPPTPPPARTDPPATAAPTPSPTPTILRPRLRAVLIDGPRIAIRWTATWRAARYVLVATASRSGPAADPVYPGSRVIGEFVTPPERAFRIRVPDGVVEVRLMVVALRADGRVLRRSLVATVVIPPPATPMGEASPTPNQAPTPTPAPTPAPTQAP